jgi:hypothetical protein
MEALPDALGNRMSDGGNRRAGTAFGVGCLLKLG